VFQSENVEHVKSVKEAPSIPSIKAKVSNTDWKHSVGQWKEA
jgi:hypothetical protein